MRLGPVIRLLRVRQWTKNLLVFAAFLFAGKFRDPEAVRLAIIAFGAMCLVSSGTYAVNDILDVNRDREHPERKNRPLASGALTTGSAWIIAAICLVGGLAMGGFLLNTSSLSILCAYLLLQSLYNAAFKAVPVADVFLISTGFVFRAVLGAAAIWVPISGWLLFCTGSLALMLGFAKRRHEFLLQGDSKLASRESLGGYSKGALDALVIATATASTLCYGIYAIESETARKFPALILSTLFVAYGIARYLLLVFTKEEGGEPADILLRDPHVLASVVLFVASAVFALSGVQVPLLDR
ncbi:MAG: decaprenyl-phosphate phosphoribosyltransferase [Armatimonadetes bacterium]|nr:decaprenyl-phosphate phosphoribosyltransferase [Armatimonadota bacterium]